MEDIKHQIEFWKANEKKAKKAGNVQTARDSNFIVKGLKLALSFVEKPRNTRMHVDTTPCEYEYKHKEWLKSSSGYKYCAFCGELL